MKQLKFILFLAFIAAATQGLQSQIMFNQLPSRIVGQPALQQTGQLTMIAPNLVEGREFNGPQAVALDTSTSPPILYVADTNNNRILAWQNAMAFTNGDHADKVIGQRDCYSTFHQGPSQGTSALSTGLTEPTALAVDSKGNLYVADAGNNRILRYPAPFQQNAGVCNASNAQGTLLNVDLVLGQNDLNSFSVNQGNSTPSASSVVFLNGNNPFRLGLAFDSQGNLWVSDAGNNRVLEFPAGSLSAGNNGAAATLVLGQLNFTSSTVPNGSTAVMKNFLAAPAGLAFDPGGNLFVADQANRVVVYSPPFSTGMSAVRIMGVIPPTMQNPHPASISAGTLGGSGGPPQAIFFVGSNPWVVDTGNARILGYAPLKQWPPESSSFSPVATAVIGQQVFTSNMSNQGRPAPSPNSFSGPIAAHAGTSEAYGVVAAAFDGSTFLYVVDAGNNRVLALPESSGFVGATRVLGQVDFIHNSINLIEGREFFFAGGGAAAIDWTSNPPHLYVSDPSNNRVLGFADYRKVGPGVTADLVIGQPDGFTAMVNYPKNDPSQPSSSSLASPEGLAIDASGNLWVADTGNGRVLRFPAPFSQSQMQLEAANLVIGQAGFTQKILDPSSATMRAPYGIAFTYAGHLLVSDSAFNRVLFFLKPNNGDFSIGQAANNVIGQPDYGPPSEPAGVRALSTPRLITVDPDDKLYVADSGHDRVVIYYRVPTLGIDPEPSFSLAGLGGSFGNLKTPYAVFSDQNTGQIWVADTFSDRLLRFPRFGDLVDLPQNPTPDFSIASNGPVAVAIDPFDNPVAPEGGTNRVAFFYPEIDSNSGNAANYFQRFAPAMLASIFAIPGTSFGAGAAQASSTPLPTTLGNVQVLVAGVAAPLLYTSASQINLQVPSSTPAGPNPVEFRVVNPTTSQIIASAFFRIDPFAPGLFSADSSGNGQLAALNQDNSVNGPSKPAKAGTIIQLFGTGIGLVSGQPSDGTPTPTSPLLPSADQPQVFINGVQLDPSDVTFSGLAPGFIGLWQVNAKIPASVPTPDVPVPVAILYQGINTRADALGGSRMTTIRTTP